MIAGIVPKKNEDYDIVEHVHRFAAWTASSAAMRGANHNGTGRGNGLNTARGLAIITTANLRGVLSDPKRWLDGDIDAQHRVWRGAVKSAAKTLCPLANFSDGVAAKLINVYLKAGLVTIKAADDASIGGLHPPIDSELLHELAEVERATHPGRSAFWAQMAEHGWSKFNSDEYEAVILNVRGMLGAERRLWKVEKYWRGY